MEFYPIIGVSRTVGSRAESSLYGLRAFTSTKYSFIESNKQYSNKTNNNGEKIGEFKGEHDAFGFEYLESQNGFDIYINENYIPMGFAYDEFMTQSDFEKKYSKTDRDKMLCKYLVVPDDMVAYYSQFMTRVTVKDAVKASQSVFTQSVSDRREMCCDSFEYDSYGFNASITLDEPKIVYFSVPYEENGWHAKVNGKDKDVLRVTYGFVAVECEAGVNEIEFNYTTPGLLVSTEYSFSDIDITLPGGVWISLGGLFVYVLYMLYFKVLKKQKATNKFFSFDFYDDLGVQSEPSQAVEVKAIPIAESTNDPSSEAALDNAEEAEAAENAITEDIQEDNADNE
jgi:hypothetical protein